MRWFNDKVLEKMISFSRIIKEKNVHFKSIDFKQLISGLDKDSFIYMDPPYRLTTGSYNDGKRGFEGWGLDAEKGMFEFANFLNEKSIRFMISYVVEHKGKTNTELQNWIEENNYTLIEIDDIPGISRKEVLIINYDLNDTTEIYNKKQISERGLVPRSVVASCSI